MLLCLLCPSHSIWETLFPCMVSLDSSSIPHTRPPSRVMSSQALVSTLFQRPPGECSLKESIQDYFYRERKKNEREEKKKRASREQSGREGEGQPEGKPEGREGVPPVHFYRHTSPGFSPMPSSRRLQNTQPSLQRKKNRFFPPGVKYKWPWLWRTYLGLLKHHVPMSWHFHQVFIVKGQRMS